MVGVTGSVGKTSTKEMIAAVLGEKYRVKKSEGNLNTEWGLCWALLEVGKPAPRLGSWARAMGEAALTLLKKTPRVDYWVLEMGVDKPGDMDEILKVFTPNIMVFLNVKNVHVGAGQFANRQAVYEEKSKAVVAVPPGGWVILNHDDTFVRQLEGKLPAHSITIGGFASSRH